jgi:hypothetical protein
VGRAARGVFAAARDRRRECRMGGWRSSIRQLRTYGVRDCRVDLRVPPIRQLRMEVRHLE